MADADPLEVWTVATFNAVTFGLVGVLAGHLSGGLSGVLPGLGTLSGVLAFGYLWALVVAATRWTLAEGGLNRLARDGVKPFSLRGMLAGGFVGASFLVGIVLVNGLALMLTSGFELLSLGLIVLLGGVISAVVGALVGVVFAVVDTALYRVAVALGPGLPAAREQG